MAETTQTKTIFDYVGGRKFVFAVGVFATATVLFVQGLLDAETWKWATIFTFGAYSGVNAAQKIGLNLTSTTTTTPQPESTPGT